MNAKQKNICEISFGSKKLSKKNWGKENQVKNFWIDMKKIWGIKIFCVKKIIWNKKKLGAEKNFGLKKLFGKKKRAKFSFKYCILVTMW